MMHCLRCDEPIAQPLSWHHLFYLAKNERLCQKCKSKLEPISGEMCRRCGRPLAGLAEEYREHDTCHDCVRWEKGRKWNGLLYKNRSLFLYNGAMKDMIAQFKYRGDAVLMDAFQHQWQTLYRTTFKGFTPVPIPLTEARLYERGFNQAEILANLLPVPTINVLKRAGTEAKQSQKTRSERLAERPVFSVMSRALPEKVVVIDDLYTTGATVRQAAYALKHGGAKVVGSMTLVRS